MILLLILCDALLVPVIKEKEFFTIGKTQPIKKSEQIDLLKEYFLKLMSGNYRQHLTIPEKKQEKLTVLQSTQLLSVYWNFSVYAVRLLHRNLICS